MNGWRDLLPNGLYIAAREYAARARTRSFQLGTLVLAVVVLGVMQVPVLINYFEQGSQTKVQVLIRAANVPSDALTVLDGALNGTDTSNGGHRQYVLERATDEASAEQALAKGSISGLLVVDRAASGDLSFVLRADVASDGRQATQARTAVNLLAIEDRLARAGVSLAAIQTPASMTIQPVKGEPSGGAGPSSGRSTSDEIASNLISTMLIVLIFFAIIQYGTWVAMSVAEEKGSRVMELMLNAATPRQMLLGKVLGNGLAGLTQYAALLLAALVGLLLQGRFSVLLTGSPDSGPPLAGLTPTMFLAFLVLFILGFLLYALLYAALGSLVSRQEDVQAATGPLMVLIFIGYFAAIAGLQAIEEPWVVLLSFVPFFAPYLMLARVAAGHVSVAEFGLAVAILVASCGAVLFLAARVYSAGVLLYGQRVSLRKVLSATRVAR